MKKIFFALLTLSVFANMPSDVFSWSGTPSSSVNLANSAGAAVTPKQNLAKGEAGGGGSVPVGTIIAWPVATNPSDADKWLECKGQTITQAAYPELYAVVGSRVPDYQGMFLRGYGGNAAALGVQQGDAIRNITAKKKYGMDAVGNPNNYLAGAFVVNEPVWYDQVGGLSWINFNIHDLGAVGWWNMNFDASRVVPTANENRPINKAVRYLIRAKS